MTRSFSSTFCHLPSNALCMGLPLFPGACGTLGFQFRLRSLVTWHSLWVSVYPQESGATISAQRMVGKCWSETMNSLRPCLGASPAQQRGRHEGCVASPSVMLERRQQADSMEPRESVNSRTAAKMKLMGLSLYPLCPFSRPECASPPGS